MLQDEDNLQFIKAIQACTCDVEHDEHTDDADDTVGGACECERAAIEAYPR